MNRRVTWLMAALAMSGFVGAALAQTSSDSGSTATPSTTTPHRWHRGHDMFVGRGLLRAMRQLNLTADQKQSVKTILVSARQQEIAARKAGGAPDFTVLSNPADPNYAAAIQDLQSRMTARIQRQTQIEQQLYGVLNDEQKSQLPQVLAGMKAKMAARFGAGA